MHNKFKIRTNFVERICPSCHEKCRTIGSFMDTEKKWKSQSASLSFPMRKCEACDLSFFDLAPGVNDFDSGMLQYYQDDLRSRMSATPKLKPRYLMLDRLVAKMFPESVRILSLGSGTASVKRRFEACGSKIQVSELLADVYPPEFEGGPYLFCDLNDVSSFDKDRIVGFCPDILVVDNVLEHLPNFDATSEIINLSKPRYCYVSVPNRASWKFIGRKKEFYWPTQHVNNFNVRSIKKILGKFGYLKRRKFVSPTSYFSVRDWCISLSLSFISPAGIYHLYERKDRFEEQKL